MRLQQYLSRAGVCSRRAAEDLIVQGLVEVNGLVVTELGVKVDLALDSISVKGELVSILSPKLMIFHKPAGVVSTMRDTHGRKTIADFIPKELGRLFPVGRLDFDVHGLLLLTNDGDFAERLLHPRYEVSRVYEAKVRGDFDEEARRMLLNGVIVDRTLVRVKSIDVIERSPYLSEARKVSSSCYGRQSFVTLTVAEGSKHLVKKLLAVVGYPVLELCRVSFGHYRLGDLPKGQLKAAEFKIS